MALFVAHTKMFLYAVFLSVIENINLLLTEREGRTGEYWPEVVAVRTERSEVRTKTTEGQYSTVRLEQARLVSSLLYGTPWKRSVLQNPDRERTNQSTGICLRLGLPYNKYIYFYTLLCVT